MFKRDKRKAPQGIDAILDRLASFSSDDRLAAMSELEALGPEGFVQLIQATNDLTQQWSNNKRRYKLIAKAYGVFAALSLAVLVALAVSAGRAGNNGLVGAYISLWFGGIFGGMGGGILGGFSYLHNTPWKLYAAMEVLNRAEDPACVGALITGSAIPDARMRATVLSRIAKLLPIARIETLQQLLPEQRSQLVRILSFPAAQNSHALLAVLSALQRLDDRTAIRQAKRLASQNNGPHSVQVAAEHYIAFVTASGAELTANLLRPATSPEADGVLLRPAGYDAVESPSALLRPAASGDDEPAVTSLEEPPSEVQTLAGQ